MPKGFKSIGKGALMWLLLTGNGEISAAKDFR
jgi:hypothetical protein